MPDRAWVVNSHLHRVLHGTKREANDGQINVRAAADTTKHGADCRGALTLGQCAAHSTRSCDTTPTCSCPVIYNRLHPITHDCSVHFGWLLLTDDFCTMKYREVPRYQGNSHPRGGSRVNHAFHHGVSTGARAMREAENARLEALASPNGPTYCALVAVGALYLGVVFDATAWGTTGWGYAEEDTFYTKVGLWQICNVSREPLVQDNKEEFGDGLSRTEVETTVQRCVFPTSVPQDWIHKSLVMEIMGGFCALALFFCLSIYLASLKFSFIESRSMMITLIPLALLAALMNFIGALTISLNLSTIHCRPSYSVALDFLGVVSFAVGGILALLDIQGCFDDEEENLEPQPPLVNPRPGIVFTNS